MSDGNDVTLEQADTQKLGWRHHQRKKQALQQRNTFRSDYLAKYLSFSLEWQSMEELH